jgi:predicted negative regulator of RcsB-dependent stress response
VLDHLGDAYWRVGRRVEARYQWRRALANKPEPDQKPIIEKKLENGLPDIEPGKRGG